MADETVTKTFGAPTGAPTKKDKGEVLTTDRKYAIMRIGGKTDKTDADTVYCAVASGSIDVELNIQRNTYVPVPVAVIHTLRNAMKPQAVQAGIDHRGAPVLELQDIQRFSLEIPGYISEATYRKLRKLCLPKDKGGEGRQITEAEMQAAVGT